MMNESDVKKSRLMAETNESQGEFKYFENSVNWESSKVRSLEKSNNRAWFVAKSAVLLSLLMGFGLAAILPLKEAIPYVVRIDKSSGATDIITVLNNKEIDAKEANDMHWLAVFVSAYESYEWYTINKDYETVGLMASAQVGKEYASLFEGETNFDETYGKKISVSIKLVSVVARDDEIGTVRFIKTTKNLKNSNVPDIVSHHVATIGYRYLESSEMTLEDRLVNPYAFQVTSYSVSRELN